MGRRLQTFAGSKLDRTVWTPHYLPMWSSRAATMASHEVAEGLLRLWIDPDTPLWCPDVHDEPLRVSAIQSGNRSGPVGSTQGQQAIHDGQRVQEFQPRHEGWLPRSGTMTIRCRMDLSPRSMAAMWLNGFEDHPGEGGELCVVEVFGRTRQGAGVTATAEVGVGVKQVADPRLQQDFVAPRLALDVGEFHTYGATWGDGRSTFTVDDEVVHQSPQAPDYPMQVMIAVFDFPGWSDGEDDAHVPVLEVDWIEHRP